MIGTKEVYDIFEVIYPVGIIIELATDANPRDLFGIGEWEQIKDKFILAAGDGAVAGSTGGQDTITLSEANIPAHTHTRGTMDITGKFVAGSDFNVSTDISSYIDGAFSASVVNGTDRNASAGDYDAIRSITLKASNSWTGETSSVGEGEAFSNMPPYYVAYMWRRVS